MEPQQLETIIRDALKDGVTLNLWSYLIVAVVTLAGGFLGGLARTYSEERIKNLATKHDFEQIKTQLATTTQITEEIKTQSTYAQSYMDTKGKQLATKEDFSEIFEQFTKTEDYKANLQKTLQEAQANLNAELQNKIFEHQENMKAELLDKTKGIELQLTRRSAFVERILLDKYQHVRETESKIEAVATNLNRLNSNSNAPADFIVDGDIVPLTEIYEQLEVHKYLLTERFYNILLNQAQLLLKMARVNNPEKFREIASQYITTRAEFQKAMNDEFQLDQIRW